MVDAIFHAFGVGGVVLRWRPLEAHIASLFDMTSSPSLNRVIILTHPCVDWNVYALDTANVVTRWIEAASAVSYSEVDQSMVEALSVVSYDDTMWPHIPVGVWAWLNKRPSLPPVCQARLKVSQEPIIRHVRGLGDIEILKSYFLLLWSEWQFHWDDSLAEMETSIREDFSGTMVGHRYDLAEHLDHVQEQLDQGLEYFRQYQPWIDEESIRRRKEQYGHLRNVLQGIAMESCKPPRLIFSSWRTDPCGCFQNPMQPSPVLCLSRVRDFGFSVVRRHSRACSASVLAALGLTFATCLIHDTNDCIPCPLFLVNSKKTVYDNVDRSPSYIPCNVHNGNTLWKG